MEQINTQQRYYNSRQMLLKTIRRGANMLELLQLSKEYKNAADDYFRIEEVKKE